MQPSSVELGEHGCARTNGPGWLGVAVGFAPIVVPFQKRAGEARIP
jgi:hypothetical protein